MSEQERLRVASRDLVPVGEILESDFVHPGPELPGIWPSAQVATVPVLKGL